MQDRLLYLRLHPLFHGVTLGDIDLLADALQVAAIEGQVLSWVQAIILHDSWQWHGVSSQSGLDS